MDESQHWTPERIKALRRRAGLTQEAMARELRVALQTLVRWEGGKRSPTGLYEKVLDDFRARSARSRRVAESLRCFVSFLPRLADQHRHGCAVPADGAHECPHYQELGRFRALCTASFRLCAACKECVMVA